MTPTEKLDVAERRVEFWQYMAILAACNKRNLHSLMWYVALTLFDAPSKETLKTLRVEALKEAEKLLTPEEAEMLRRIRL